MKDFKHPYKEYENSLLWKLIEESLDDLIKNQDIDLNTRKEYVVGYLSKNIFANLNKLKE